RPAPPVTRDQPPKLTLRRARTRPFRPAFRPAGGKMGADSRAAMTSIVAWPVTLRRVRAWLDPWACLSRWWRAWSTAPPPPEIQALLRAVETGFPLHLYLPESQSTVRPLRDRGSWPPVFA